MHLQNPFMPIIEIANNLKCAYSTACEYLYNENNYKVVKGLCVDNEYFLFTDLLEKKITSDNDRFIKNGLDFNEKEKTYLRGFGFKF